MQRVLIVALGLLALAPAHALADEPESPGPEPVNRRLRDGLVVTTLDQLITEPRLISPTVLRALPADPMLLGSTGVELERLARELESARLRSLRAAEDVRVRTATVSRTGDDLQRAGSALESATRRTGAAQRNLTQFSVEAFIGRTDQPDLAAIVSTSSDATSTVATQALRTTRLFGAAGNELAVQLAARVRAEDERRAEQAEARNRLRRENSLLETARREHETQTELMENLTPRVARAQQSFERELVLRPLPSTSDLTVLAVDAYHNAVSIAARRWPECRISWHQLAGVGRVESFHGQFGASSLDRSGNAAPTILGPQLNGERWLAIDDTDLGLLDDDLEWDRAVGPMQFIPTSWATFGADGNGDGQEDPNNLYDSALAAADHLCGTDLDQPDRFRKALLGYNRSARYGSDVIRFSTEYAELADLAPPWEVSGL